VQPERLVLDWQQGSSGDDAFPRSTAALIWAHCGLPSQAQPLPHASTSSVIPVPSKSKQGQPYSRALANESAVPAHLPVLASGASTIPHQHHAVVQLPRLEQALRRQTCVASVASEAVTWSLKHTTHGCITHTHG
jgi:hypothetical protein